MECQASSRAVFAVRDAMKPSEAPLWQVRGNTSVSGQIVRGTSQFVISCLDSTSLSILFYIHSFKDEKRRTSRAYSDSVSDKPRRQSTLGPGEATSTTPRTCAGATSPTHTDDTRISGVLTRGTRCLATKCFLEVSRNVPTFRLTKGNHIGTMRLKCQ